MIKFPVRVQADPGSTFAHIRDAANKVVAGGLIPIGAEQLVAAANAGAKLQHAQPLEKQPRLKNARQRIVEDLKASDVTGLMAERDNIVYGPHDQLPQCGEPVARLGKTSRSGE